MSMLSQFKNGIKSIQSGTIALGGSDGDEHTATISSVVTAKSELFHMGIFSGGMNAGAHYGGLSLTNSTTVTAYGSTISATIAYRVVEYY
jgi:hypothetical protein